jgi:hypothetical protein
MAFDWVFMELYMMSKVSMFLCHVGQGNCGGHNVDGGGSAGTVSGDLRMIVGFRGMVRILRMMDLRNECEQAATGFLRRFQALAV